MADTLYHSSQLKADDIDQQFEIRYLLRSAKQYFTFHCKGSLSV